MNTNAEMIESLEKLPVSCFLLGDILAIFHAKKVIEIMPDHPETHTRLKSILQTADNRRNKFAEFYKGLQNS